MEYEKRIRCLENYRVRTIPQDIVTTINGEEITDTSSPRYFYGTIPDFKIDENFNYILDSNGQKIPNTIPVNIFLKQKFDDIGIFTNSIYGNETGGEIIDETPERPDPEVAGYICYGDEENTMNVYSCYPAQTITQIQDAQADGFSVFLTSNFGSAQGALAACQSNCAPPFDGDGIKGDASLCSGDLQLNAVGDITYIMINGSPLPQSCCVMDVTGTVVYWDGEFCRPRGK